ncbi:hypothetical protein G7046_g8653 [Stylonectria norvegica]|nr:hypothetical protein G7046_g8653 [Stylonectria norvegica]
MSVGLMLAVLRLGWAGAERINGDLEMSCAVAPPDQPAEKPGYRSNTVANWPCLGLHLSSIPRWETERARVQNAVCLAVTSLAIVVVTGSTTKRLYCSECECLRRETCQPTKPSKQSKLSLPAASCFNDALPPDALINTDDGIKYWESIDADVNGMLGGFSSISRADLQGSRTFLARLGIGLKSSRSPVRRALEGGAGIGRVTEGLLLKVAERVDIVEPVAKFTAALQGKDGVGDVFNIGLEEWVPAQDIQYDLIWIQWCVGHLTDEQLIRFFERCKAALSPDDGVVVLKENLSGNGKDIFDEVDSSVTSPRGHYESSDNSLGFFDDGSDPARRAMAAGAVWLNLDIEVKEVLKTAKRDSGPVKPCKFCVLLVNALQHYFAEWFTDDLAVKKSELGFRLADGQDPSITLVLVEGEPIVVRTWDSPDQPRYNLFAFEISRELNETKTMLPHCGSFKARSERSDDEPAWSFIHDCIETCNAGHPLCKNSKSARRLPKRLLDIGTPDHSVLRLYDTSLGEQGDYAALSHCWGTGYPLRTLTGSLEQMRSRIELHDLDSTFQNAIEVTRHLSLRYIWIDSLCIIQDSVEDWNEQAAQMADIYSQAYVSIATGSSPNPSTSFLGVRDGSWKTWRLELADNNQTEQCWVRRKVLPQLKTETRGSHAHAEWAKHAISSSSRSTLNYQWDGPLYTRAWCFQEQLLSRRMIHYAPGAIIWECQVQRQVEGEDAVALQPDASAAKNDRLLTDVTELADSAREWSNVIVDYTKRDMTFSKDRLIALSGVAKHKAERTGDEYRSGLWKSSLFRDLLWHCIPWFPTAVPEKYIAPSWSWASLVGPVVWNQHAKKSIQETYATIEGAETVPKSSVNPFGDVSSGSVAIRGPILKTRLRMDRAMAADGDVHIIASWEKTGSGHFVLPDTKLYEADGLLEGGVTEKTYRRANPGEDHARYGDGDDLEYDMEVTVVCFLCTKALDVVGLVLGRSPTVPGAYVRLALAWKLPREYIKRAEVGVVTIV